MGTVSLVDVSCKMYPHHKYIHYTDVDALCACSKNLLDWVMQPAVGVGGRMAEAQGSFSCVSIESSF